MATESSRLQRELKSFVKLEELLPLKRKATMATEIRSFDELEEMLPLKRKATMSIESSRLQKELKSFNKLEESLLGIMSLTPDPNDIHHLTATIRGPDSSPYHGGLFHIDITLPDDYPFSPPQMKFTTKVWHPNISSQTGAICGDLLQNNWSPAITLRSILLCLQVLLSHPEPKDPQDADVAKQYLTDHAAFTATARHWTENFAMVSSAQYNSMVQKLSEMGFPEAVVKNTIEAAGGDECVALKRLCL